MKNQTIIFLHSLFRTGSTYVFDKFRSNPDYYCYYEPFNESLANYSKVKALSTGDKAQYSAMRHPVHEKDYFYEYPFNANGEGVPFFKKKFSFDLFCLNEKEDDIDLKRYLDHLVKYAQKRPVFQFCRSSLRTSWLKKNFASTNIYLVRDPRDQWMSYNSFEHNYFNIVDILILFKINCYDVGWLKEILGIDQIESDDLATEYRYYEFVSNGFSPQTSYMLFYTIWLISLFNNIINCDFIIDLESIEDAIDEKQRVGKFLLEHQISIDFDDLKYKKYSSYDLTTEQFLEIENYVNTKMDLHRFCVDHEEMMVKLPTKILRNFFNFSTLSSVHHLEPSKIDYSLIIKTMYEKFSTVYDHMKNVENTNMDYAQTSVEHEQRNVELEQIGAKLIRTNIELKKTTIELEKTKAELNEIKATLVWRIAKRMQKITQIFRRSSIREK